MEEIQRSPVEVGSFSHSLQGFSTIPGGWPWDFWTIKSMTTDALFWRVFPIGTKISPTSRHFWRWFSGSLMGYVISSLEWRVTIVTRVGYHPPIFCCKISGDSLQGTDVFLLGILVLRNPFLDCVNSVCQLPGLGWCICLWSCWWFFSTNKPHVNTRFVVVGYWRNRVNTWSFWEVLWTARIIINTGPRRSLLRIS